MTAEGKWRALSYTVGCPLYSTVSGISLGYPQPGREHSHLSLTRGFRRLPVGPIADLFHQRLMVVPIKGHGAMYQDV